MSVTDLFARIRSTLTTRLSILGCLLIGAVGIAVGQATAPAPAASKPAVPVLLIQASGFQWKELTAAQKQILRPLAETWNTLSTDQKNKWIALSQGYPQRSATEQQKIQNRMVGWAALTPDQRERARLNFAETKKVSRSERVAEWETYQNLSTEEKQKLAAKGKAKPVGAAVAVKPVAPSKLTPVPVTRHTSPDEAAAVKPRIDPKTLLPLPQLSPVVAPAPIPTLAPVPTPAPAEISPSVPAINIYSISPN